MTRKFSGDTLVIATHNKKKIEELRVMFGDRIKNLQMASDLGLESPAETGTTFIENSTLKAVYTAKETGLPSLADDSGLCISALNGAPGVYSADWAEENGPARDWEYAKNKVHELMGDNPDKKAHFAASFVLAWPDGHTESVEGYVHGSIVWPPRGDQGFAYDPIFIPQGHDRTFAEMEMAEKSAMSHRANAFKLMMDKCFK